MKIRPTGTEARIKRHMRQAQRRATVATRDAAHAAHKAEWRTVASHLRSLGVDDTTATGMAATLRKKATGGRKGFALADGHRRACTRYTRGQFLAALTVYKPRKDTYKAARLLALAA